MFSPMLAKNYDESKAAFPAFAQPKLDGIRLCWDGIEMYTRNGNVIVSMPRLRALLVQYFSGVPLDGELYSDELSFQQIAAVVRRKVAIDEDDRIGFWVYDYPVEMPHEQRFAGLAALFATANLCGLRCGGRIRMVETVRVGSAAKFEAVCERFIAQGFEGGMYRSADGMYEAGKRSDCLLKYKRFVDFEAVIEGFEAGKGRLAGSLGSLQVVGKIGGSVVRFGLGSGIDAGMRRKIWRNKQKYVGQRVTVKYQELTDGGVPRFPVYVSVRDYE